MVVGLQLAEVTTSLKTPITGHLMQVRVPSRMQGEHIKAHYFHSLQGLNMLIQENILLMQVSAEMVHRSLLKNKDGVCSLLCQLRGEFLKKTFLKESPLLMI
jgi:hypothetical protein